MRHGAFVADAHDAVDDPVRRQVERLHLVDEQGASLATDCGAGHEVARVFALPAQHKDLAGEERGRRITGD